MRPWQLVYTRVRQGLPLVYNQLVTNCYMSSPYNHDVMVLNHVTNVHNSPSIFWHHESLPMQNRLPTGFWTCLKTWWLPIFHWKSHNYSRTHHKKKVTLQTTLLQVANGSTIVVPSSLTLFMTRRWIVAHWWCEDTAVIASIRQYSAKFANNRLLYHRLIVRGLGSPHQHSAVLGIAH